MLDDRDRPLAPRGKKAAKAIARYLRREPIRPALVLCSSAKRARQTLERVLPSLGDDVPIEVNDELYTFDADALVHRLRRVPAAVPSVLVVGHNPAMEDMVERLTGHAVSFPTGALASLRIPVAWSRISPGANAELVAFVTPRELRDAKR